MESFTVKYTERLNALIWIKIYTLYMLWCRATALQQHGIDPGPLINTQTLKAVHMLNFGQKCDIHHGSTCEAGRLTADALAQH